MPFDAEVVCEPDADADDDAVEDMMVDGGERRRRCRRLRGRRARCGLLRKLVGGDGHCDRTMASRARGARDHGHTQSQAKLLNALLSLVVQLLIAWTPCTIDVLRCHQRHRGVSRLSL